MKHDEEKNSALVKRVKLVFEERFVSKSRTKKSFSIVDTKGVFDFKIRYANRDLAYIETTEYVKPYISESSVYKWLGFREHYSVSQYIIVTDCRTFVIWSGAEDPILAETIDDLYRVIVTDKRDTEDSIKEDISRVVYTFVSKSLPNLLHKAKIEYSKDLIHQLEYDAIINQANFKLGFELDLFGSLLDDVPEGTEVFRYTSLSTLLHTIRDCKYRLNCIVAMNDRSEINYVERYLNNNLNLVELKESEVKYANKRFISSFTVKKDDLSLWRMYTENASGVCMVFKVVSSSMSDGCFLKKVSYADSNNYHQKLDVLKNLLDNIKTTLQVEFKFYTLYIWKHFFKPCEYKDEKEVRLLYYSAKPNRSWDLNTHNGIVSPYVEFDLFGTLPIELHSVILGPRFAEKEVNTIQIQEAIIDSCRGKKASRNQIKVSLSKIKSYR